MAKVILGWKDPSQPEDELAEQSEKTAKLVREILGGNLEDLYIEVDTKTREVKVINGFQGLPGWKALGPWRKANK